MIQKRVKSGTSKVPEQVGKKTKAGGKRPGSGRKPGTPNRVTADARAAIGRFVDDNASRMQAWLDEVALDSPERAFNMLKDVIEYHVPKLNRTEVTGKDGDAVDMHWTVEVVRPRA